MNDTVLSPKRGRPRGFCTDAALGAAERLFAERGYAAVSVAELCDAMGVRPPSFYAAFGSKADCFARVVERYAGRDGGAVLRRAMERYPDPRIGIPEMLLSAASAYAQGALGCLVMEGARGADDAGVQAACAVTRAATHAGISDYAAAATDDPDGIAGLVLTALTGLSGAARHGASEAELSAFAGLVGQGIAARMDGHR